jgi:hypothetical protein
MGYFIMTGTRGILGLIEPPHDCVTRITRKGNLSSPINQWREILAPAEVKLANVIRRISISMKGWHSVIRFFLVEGQEPSGIHHCSHLHYQDHAMKNVAFYFCDAEIRAGTTALFNHSSIVPLIWSSTYEAIG